MSRKKIPLRVGSPERRRTTRKTVVIGIEENKDGRRFTSLNPRGPISPPEMIDALLDSLAAVYLNLWGGPPQEGDSEAMTPEQFCELAATKLLARLANAKVGQPATVQ
jgi:hypothetical protein